MKLFKRNTKLPKGYRWRSFKFAIGEIFLIGLSIVGMLFSIVLMLVLYAAVILIAFSPLLIIVWLLFG